MQGTLGRFLLAHFFAGDGVLGGASDAVEIPYQNKQGMRRLTPVGEALSKKGSKRLTALARQYDDLCEGHDEDTVPDEVRTKVAAIQTEIADLENRPPQFGDKLMAKAGVFVSIDHIVKALLVHAARWPDDSANLIVDIFGPEDRRRHTERADNISRLLGYGMPDIARVLECIGTSPALTSSAFIMTRARRPLPSAKGWTSATRNIMKTARCRGEVSC